MGDVGKAGNMIGRYGRQAPGNGGERRVTGRQARGVAGGWMSADATLEPDRISRAHASSSSGSVEPCRMAERQCLLACLCGGRPCYGGADKSIDNPH